MRAPFRKRRTSSPPLLRNHDKIRAASASRDAAASPRWPNAALWTPLRSLRRTAASVSQFQASSVTMADRDLGFVNYAQELD